MAKVRYVVYDDLGNILKDGSCSKKSYKAKTKDMPAGENITKIAGALLFESKLESEYKVESGFLIKRSKK